MNDYALRYFASNALLGELDACQARIQAQLREAPEQFKATLLEGLRRNKETRQKIVANIMRLGEVTAT